MLLGNKMEIIIDVSGLRYSALVDSQREKVYQCLEEYCRQQNPQQSQRFAKLLLRLPALRSLSLKCIEANEFIISSPSTQVFFIETSQSKNILESLTRAIKKFQKILTTFYS